MCRGNEWGDVLFNLHADYSTAGDQQQAIDQLVDQLEKEQERCILLESPAQVRPSPWRT